MADNFPSAIEVILDHEGGLTNDANDHGGITNFGLTIMWLNDKADPMKYVGHPLPWTPDDIRNMTRDLAVQIYRECLWDVNDYGQIDHETVATKVFDMAVNHGEVRGEKFAQRAANQVGCQPPLTEDGHLGPKSFIGINSVDPDALVHKMCDLQAGFYQQIVDHDPTQAKFLKGWLRRAKWPY